MINIFKLLMFSRPGGVATDKKLVLNVMEIGFHQSQLGFTRPGGVATEKKLKFCRPGGVATNKKLCFYQSQLGFNRPGGVATEKKLSFLRPGGVATNKGKKLQFARDDYIGAARGCIGSVCAPNLHAQICLRVWGDMHRVRVN